MYALQEEHIDLVSVKRISFLKYYTNILYYFIVSNVERAQHQMQFTVKQNERSSFVFADERQSDSEIREYTDEVSNHWKMVKAIYLRFQLNSNSLL